MFYVYLIQSIKFPEKIYTGITNDMQKRISTHNTGGSVYTAPYKPWKLVVYTGFDNEKKARSFEKYLKSGSGRAFAKRHLW